ncbi:MAG: AI-2E family transporter, partial [Actinobacteria bacterium]|nr:AI-2E family transporter [Actinomycetota bacterium]
MEEPQGPLISSPAVARVARWGLVAWAVIGVAVVAYLAFRFVIYPIRIVFPPLLVALIIVFLLNPIVSRLQRRGIPRLWGTLLSYVVFLTGAGIGLAYLIPLVSQQVAAFDLQQLVAKATDALADLGRRIGFDVSGASLVGREEAAGFLARITEITSGVLHVVLIFVLGPIIAFYLLLDL